MKILLTTDWWTPAVNGVVRSVTLLRRELLAQGHDVRVLTLSSTNQSYEEDGVYYLGSMSADRVYPGARVRLLAWSRWLKALASWRPDVIHSQCEFSTFLPAWQLARRCNCPLVHTYHTVYEDYTRYVIPSERCGRAAVKEFTRLVSGRCDAILAPTNKVTGLLQEYRVSCPVYTVPTGIDLTAFRPIRPEDKPALRRTLGLPEQEKILVSVGRLAAEKNHGELLRLLAREPADTRPLLLFVGDGPVRAQLEQQAADLGLVDRVMFAGMVPPGEVVRYYQAGDAFVCASQSETQGLTYFEALACGLPAIVRADPCLEGVVENGVNGWQWKDAAGFHQALEVLLSGMRNDSLRAGALATAERYSAGHFAAQAMQVYSEAIERRRTLNGGLPAPVAGRMGLAKGPADRPGSAAGLGGRTGRMGRCGLCGVPGHPGGDPHSARRAGMPGGCGAVWPVVRLCLQLSGDLRGVHGGLRGGAVLRPPSAGADVPPQAAAEIRRLAGQKELCQMVCPGHLFPGGAG